MLVRSVGSAVDRRSQLLPASADPEVQRISPLEAAARILHGTGEGVTRIGEIVAGERGVELVP